MENILFQMQKIFVRSANVWLDRPWAVSLRSVLNYLVVIIINKLREHVVNLSVYKVWKLFQFSIVVAVIQPNCMIHM